MAERALESGISWVLGHEDRIRIRGLGNPSEMATVGTEETIGSNYLLAKTIKKKRHYGLNPHCPSPLRCRHLCSNAMMFLRNRNGKGLRVGKS